MFKRVLTVSGGVFGTAGLSILLPIEQDGNHTPQAHAQVPTAYRDFTLFSQTVEGRAVQLRKYEISDGFEVDASLEPQLTAPALFTELKELESRPLQREELEAAATIVSCGSDATKGLIDASYMQLVTHSLCNDQEMSVTTPLADLAVQLMNADPSLTGAVVRSMIRLAEESAQSPRLTGPAYVSCEGSDAWHELRQKYKCSLCLDVLCAPHLLIGCAHSFCGGCIHEHLDLGAKEDCDVVTCPKCRHEIDQSPCYEPDFDNTILAAVEQAPFSEDKSLWLERREEFLRRMRQQQRRAQRKQKESSEADGNNNASRGSFWDMVKDNYLEIIGAVAVILIMIAVKRSVGR